MNTCTRTGQRVYITAAAAYRAIGELVRKHKARERGIHGHLCGYRCTCCHHWHIGHGGHQ